MLVLLLLLGSTGALGGGQLSRELPVIEVVDNITCSTIVTSRGNGMRTTYGIAWSCLATIFACVWSSGHPNIAGPRDAGWTCLKRRVVVMICVLVAPEIVAFWALRQHRAAKQIAWDYNSYIAKAKPERQPLWDSVKEWFTELPATAAERAEGQPWSNTHGYFVQMGGFMLYEGGRAIRVLHYTDLKGMILAGQIDAPTVTESELQDRSKGDAISKGFVVLQTTWFVIQCLGRWWESLPLAELEIVTLGFALLNALIYAIWWDKPQGVGLAIPVPLKRIEAATRDNQRSQDDGIEGTVKGTTHTRDSDHRIWLVPVPQAKTDINDHALDGPGTGSSVIEIVEEFFTDTGTALFIGTPKHIESEAEEAYDKRSWWLRQLTKDGRKHHWLIFALVRVPVRSGQFLVRHLNKMLVDDTGAPGSLRVPMFHVDEGAKASGRVWLTWITSCVVGIVFGAVHLVAWSSDFPERPERLLWRISALVITAEPTFMLMSKWAFLRGEKEQQLEKYIAVIFVLPTLITIPFYIVSRLTLITLALLSLRTLPPQTYVELSWSSFIPHF